MDDVLEEETNYQPTPASNDQRITEELLNFFSKEILLDYQIRNTYDRRNIDTFTRWYAFALKNNYDSRFSSLVSETNNLLKEKGYLDHLEITHSHQSQAVPSREGTIISMIPAHNQKPENVDLERIARYG